MEHVDDPESSSVETNYLGHYSNWNLDHSDHQNHHHLYSQPKPEHQFGCQDTHLDLE